MHTVHVAASRTSTMVLQHKNLRNPCLGMCGATSLRNWSITNQYYILPKTLLSNYPLYFLLPTLLIIHHFSHKHFTHSSIRSQDCFDKTGLGKPKSELSAPKSPQPSTGCRVFFSPVFSCLFRLPLLHGYTYHPVEEWSHPKKRYHSMHTVGRKCKYGSDITDKVWLFKAGN